MPTPISSKGKWKPAGLANAGKEILFTLQGKGYSVKDFFRYVEANQRSSTLAPEKYLDLLYQQFIDTTILKLVEERISVQHPEYRYLLQEYYEGILLFDIMEKEVWSKASLDSVGSKHIMKPTKQIILPGSVPGLSFILPPPINSGNHLKQLILEGTETKLEEFISKHKIKVEVGYFKKDEQAVLQKVPWAKGVYSAENNGIYYLAWLKDILPPGPMSFEEARPAVISDYQAFLEKNWVEQLKKKYSVKINEKGKQYILQQLQVQG